ncbi:hypothetical protein [Actinoplanes sp. NPDC049599]|uniref:hypothetical protein n=1 Tax=Actinoplanes sp. NPDC049599 TaxID=3363903 RepID=UPI003794D47C
MNPLNLQGKIPHCRVAAGRDPEMAKADRSTTAHDGSLLDVTLGCGRRDDLMPIIAQVPSSARLR